MCDTPFRPATANNVKGSRRVKRGMGEAMVGINVDEIPQLHRLAESGW
ncbi:hypothetical protein [Arthrobacter sp. MW3 TE3886]